MKLTNEYIGGFLEKNGGFYMHKKKYLYFKFVMDDKYLIIISYLKNKLGIDIKCWKSGAYITKKGNIINLITFMKKYTLRDDFLVYEEQLKNQNV